METFKRIMNYCRPYWRRILIAAITSGFVGSLDGAFAYLVGPVMQSAFKDMRVFAFLPLGIVALFSFRGVCRFVNDYFIRTAGQLAIQDVRNEIYRKNMLLDLRFFNRHQTGGLMSRVLNDVNMMQDGVANIVTGLFRDGLSAITLLGVLFYRNWQLAIISLVVIPATVYPAQKIGRRIKKLSQEIQGRIEGIAIILQETFSGIKVIKAFGLEAREIDRFFTKNKDFYHFARKSIKYEALSTPLMELITSLGIAAVVWIGGYSVMHGKMTSADFLSFVAAMVIAYNPIRKLINSYNAVQRSVGASERVFEIIDAQPDIFDLPDAMAIGKVEGIVEFRNVSFKYIDDYVLKNVTIDARKGECVALVGPSGGGKTTLVSLIPRFYDVVDGAVLIDGIDVRKIKLTNLMRQIALVDQETILFHDSIANNIRYGKPDATDAEVEAAARGAFAHDFIMQMPDGYATNIGDRGVRLSGGQRQRVCIARAILKDAPILILDEATSALDTESEKMVQNALNNLMANRTTFVIAHRLSTVLHADKIVVIEHGEVVQAGTHDQLLESGGLYKKLYDMQFQDS